MKLPLTIAGLVLSLMTLTPATAGQKKNCSCQSPDGKSCAATVTCKRRGCTAICGPNKACYTACGKDPLVTRFTLKRSNISTKETISILSRYTRRPIEFIPWREKDPGPFNIEINGDNVWNTMDYLYERGKLTMGGIDWGKLQEMRSGTSQGKKLSQVDFSGMSVKDALEHLSFLTGLEFQVESGNAKKMFSVSLREVTLGEVVDRISTEAGVKIKQMEKVDSSR